MLMMTRWQRHDKLFSAGRDDVVLVVLQQHRGCARKRGGGEVGKMSLHVKRVCVRYQCLFEPLSSFYGWLATLLYYVHQMKK